MTNVLHDSRQTVGGLHWSLTRTPQFSAAPLHSYRHAAQSAHCAWFMFRLHLATSSRTCVAGSCLTRSVKSVFFDKPWSKRSLGWDTWDRRECHTIPLHRQQDTQQWAPPHREPDTGNYRAMTEYRVGIARSKSLVPPSFDGPQVQLIKLQNAPNRASGIVREPSSVWPARRSAK